MRLEITERDFSQQIIDLNRKANLGWNIYRTWSSRHSPAGFPDLTLLRDKVLLFAELKSEKGKVSPAQEEWLQGLSLVETVDVHLWRPSQWPEIEEVLR